jgi:hypothetical protein
VKRVISNKLLVVTVIVSILVTFVVSFFLYLNSDTYGVYKTNSLFSIQAVPEGISRESVEKKIEDFSIRTNTNTYYLVGGSENGGYSKDLYAYIGDKNTHNKIFPNNTYKPFDRTFRADIKSYKELGNHIVQGSYFSTASYVQLRDLSNDFKKSGINASVTPNSFVMLILYTFLMNNLYLLFIAMLVGLAFVTCFKIIRDSKIQAAMIISGFSRRRIIAKSLYLQLCIFLVSVFFVFCGLTFFFAFYNGFTQFFEFVDVFLALSLICLLVMLTMTIFSYALIFRSKDTYAFIKGKINLRYISVLSVTAQVLIFGIVFWQGATIISNQQIVNSNISNLTKYEKVTDYSAISINPGITIASSNGESMGSDSKKDKIRNANIIGLLKKIREKDMLISAKYISNIIDAEDIGTTEDNNNIVINHNFLSTQNILDSKGNVIKQIGSNDNSFTILVPQKYRNYEASVVSDVNEYISSNISAFNGDEEEKKYPDNITKKDIVYTQDNQEILNYNDGQSTQSASAKPEYVQKDPIMIVLPKTITDESRGIYMSLWFLNNSIYINKNVDINSLSKEFSLDSQIHSVASVTDSANQELNKMKQQQQVDDAGLFILIIVLLFSLFLQTMAYCNKNSKIIFSRYILGHSFIKTHGRYLLSKLALLSCMSYLVYFIKRDNFQLSITFNASLIVLTEIVMVVMLVLCQKQISIKLIKQ